MNDALNRLLTGSGLEAVRDVRTGAYAVRRAAPPTRAPLVVPRPVRTTFEETVAIPPTEMEPVRIELRRDFGRTTQSILPTGPRAAAYHHVFTRAEIEQSGVTNMAEFVTTVPGYSGEGAEALQATADFTFLGSANVYAGSFLKLRGWDAQHTAVLLNGRQLPTSPESRGPDLSRIPLAAVERIEVLPFAGSAPYGDGAVGGAMNIVLRKNLEGRSFSLQVGESTRGGGREVFFTWIEGLAAASGRTKATIIGDFQERGVLRLGDRDFLARAISRSPPQTLLPDGGPFGPDLRNLLQAEIAGYPAMFSVSAASIDLGIPGRPGAQFALVPAGQNASQLTPDAFSETNPDAVSGHRQNRLVLRRPTKSFNLNVQLEHAFVPHKLELYGEAGYSRADEVFSAPDVIEPLALSAVDPRNPFRRDAIPGFSGRSVRLHFDPLDLPDARFSQARDSARVVLGLRGTPAPRWHWVLDTFVDVSRTRATVDSYGASLNEILRRWTPSRADALVAIYDPFADHRATPISIDARERYLARHSWLDYRSRMFGADLRLSGDVWELPAGPLRVAVGAEYAWRDRTTEQQTQASRELYEILGIPSVYANLTPLRSSDDQGERIGAVAEAVVPLFREGKQRLPWHRGELNLASRVARTDNGHPAWSNLAAIKIAPSPSWAVRGTFSQGHVAPVGAIVNSPTVETLTNATVVDPKRGGIQQFYPVRVTQGGSRALRAETSRARVLGLLLTPEAVPGLFVSIDAWSITMKNRLRAPTVQEIVSHEEFFPGKLTRDPPLGWEFALGWAGPVTQVDLRPVHVARLQAEGVDVSFRYRLPSFRAGTFTLGGQFEAVHRYEEQFLPTTPAIDKIDVVADGSTGGLMESAVVSPRARGSAAWQCGDWFASIGAAYTPPYRTDTTTPTSAIPAATGVDGEFIGSSIRWDLQVGYSIQETVPTGRRGWLDGTTWTLGVRNVFDRKPAARADGTAFYSRFDDPRMRFLYLRVQWRR